MPIVLGRIWGGGVGMGLEKKLKIALIVSFMFILIFMQFLTISKKIFLGRMQ